MASRAANVRALRGADPMRRALITPEGVWLDVRLATAGARAAAFMLDLAIMAGILIAMTLLAVLAFGVVGQKVPTAIAVLWLLAFFVLRNFYFILFEGGARAATWGKRALKLRVVARDGGRLTAGAVIARNMMRELEVFLPLMLLPFGSAQGFADRWTAILSFAWVALFLFFPLFNRDRLRAGDLIAGTWVVMDERRKMGRELLDHSSGARTELATIAPFTAPELAAYGQFELQKLEEVLRTGDPDTMTTVAAAIRRKIGRNYEGRDAAFLDAYYAALRQELERKLLFGKRKADKFDTSA